MQDAPAQSQHVTDTYGQRFDRRRPDDPPPPPVPTLTIDDPETRQRVSGMSGWFSESFVAGALYVLACLIGAMGVLGGLMRLNEVADSGVRLVDAVTVAGLIIGGLALGGVLVGLAALLGALGRLRRNFRDQAHALSDLSERIERLGHLAVDPAMIDRLEERLGRLDEGVRDVAHNSLLDEQARGEKRRQLSARERDQTVEQIRREMANGEWDRARLSIERLRLNFPGEADSAARLEEELEVRRHQAEAEDIVATRRQVDELMSVSAWDRAVAAAQELVLKHPDSMGAKGLLARVDRERKLAEEQQRQGLYAQIQRHTSRREWSDAMQVADRLIGLFPHSIEAEAVKAQMETLSANAEIQHRQKVELAIRDLVKRQRFAEAIQLSEQLIGTYPSSPQANALRDQLPRLKERAAEIDKEARKRRVQWE
ncbi:MAG: hypothetical protein BIFFINMI_02763 [Phycisphaerae bacterium]|nr:hypothetical protein [Phycisphaerae bacterium]